MRGQQAAAYVAGAVVVAGVPAALLAPGIRRLVDQARAAGLGVDHELAAVVDAFDAAEQEHRPRAEAHVPAAVAALGRPRPVPPASNRSEGLGGHLASGEVARRAGVSPRAVRLAAERGRLAGRRVGGRWFFTEQAVTDWQRTRWRAA